MKFPSPPGGPDPEGSDRGAALHRAPPALLRLRPGRATLQLRRRRRRCRLLRRRRQRRRRRRGGGWEREEGSGEGEQGGEQQRWPRRSAEGCEQQQLQLRRSRSPKGNNSYSEPTNLMKKNQSNTALMSRKSTQPDDNEEDACSDTSIITACLRTSKGRLTAASAPVFKCTERAEKRKELEERHQALEAFRETLR